MTQKLELFQCHSQFFVMKLIQIAFYSILINLVSFYPIATTQVCSLCPTMIAQVYLQHMCSTIGFWAKQILKIIGSQI
jgi:hypothetical protein